MLSEFFKASALHRSMYLLINTQYVCGTIPFRFDLREEKVLPLSSEGESRRYHVTLGAHSLIRLAMALCLIRDLRRGDLRLTVPLDLIRMVLIMTLTLFGFVDFHSAWKRTEIAVATNSALRFHEMFQRKSKVFLLGSCVSS